MPSYGGGVGCEPDYELERRTDRHRGGGSSDVRVDLGAGSGCLGLGTQRP